jgi:hypothetical protein
MSEHIDIDKKPPSSRRLAAAPKLTLPRTLIELAGESNIAGSLHRKLGEEVLWLLADEMYAYADVGDDVYVEHFDDTANTPVPVRFNGLRMMSEYEPGTGTYQSMPHEQLATFIVDPRILRDIRQYYEHAVYDYPEVAIRLGQMASLLELYELNPRVLEWYQRRQRPVVIRNRYPRK